MFVVAPTTVWNPAALEVRELPRRIGGRVTLWPVGGGLRLWARVVFEVELLRYLAALLPFAGGALIWQDQALAIAQAPLLMFLVVYAAETKLMRLSPAAREGLVDQAGADRALDLLRVRARAILTRIAAGRGLKAGGLRLVVEQSELARVPPLTWVSVQAEEGPEVLRLTAEEVALVRASLFEEPLTERTLQRVNQREGVFLREERLDAREVSAHARLAALMV